MGKHQRHHRSNDLYLRTTVMMVSLADWCRCLRRYILSQLSEFQARLEDSKEMVEGMLITTNVEVWFRQSSEWCALSISSTDENHIPSVAVGVTTDDLAL